MELQLSCNEGERERGTVIHCITAGIGKYCAAQTVECFCIWQYRMRTAYEFQHHHIHRESVCVS
jgi:hypothetical protein